MATGQTPMGLGWGLILDHSQQREAHLRAVFFLGAQPGCTSYLLSDNDTGFSIALLSNTEDIDLQVLTLNLLGIARPDDPIGLGN